MPSDRTSRAATARNIAWRTPLRLQPYVALTCSDPGHHRHIATENALFAFGLLATLENRATVLRGKILGIRHSQHRGFGGRGVGLAFGMEWLSGWSQNLTAGTRQRSAGPARFESELFRQAEERNRYRSPPLLSIEARSCWVAELAA